MRISRKDAVGVGLIGATLALLAVHGVEGPGNVQPVAFVDVTVVDETNQPRPHQVVVVRSGHVSAVGPVGALETPPDALVVDGAGKEYLVPATFERSGGPRILASNVQVEPGARADFMLLDADPRTIAGDAPRPQGVMRGGTWYPAGG